MNARVTILTRFWLRSGSSFAPTPGRARSLSKSAPRNKTNCPARQSGIIGDFVLRNDKIEAVISGNLPLRRANMSTFYGALKASLTPGCLYDLTCCAARTMTRSPSFRTPRSSRGRCRGCVW